MVLWICGVYSMKKVIKEARYEYNMDIIKINDGYNVCIWIMNIVVCDIYDMVLWMRKGRWLMIEDIKYIGVVIGDIILWVYDDAIN